MTKDSAQNRCLPLSFSIFLTWTADKTRQDKTRQDKTRQDKTRQDKASERSNNTESVRGGATHGPNRVKVIPFRCVVVYKWSINLHPNRPCRARARRMPPHRFPLTHHGKANEEIQRYHQKSKCSLCHGLSAPNFGQHHVRNTRVR